MIIFDEFDVACWWSASKVWNVLQDLALGSRY